MYENKKLNIISKSIYTVQSEKGSDLLSSVRYHLYKDD